MTLKLPEGTISDFVGIERAFLWAGSDKVSGGQCKVSWKLVCRPKRLGGLGILDIRMYARALRLRWLWYEWKEPHRAWVGIGNPCDTTDRDLFYAATTISVGDGRMARFWLSPWLDETKPKDIAPAIFAISANKHKSVREALLENHWTQWINMSEGLSVEHIEQLCALWGSSLRYTYRTTYPMISSGTSPPTVSIPRPRPIGPIRGCDRLQHDHDGVEELGSAQVQVFCVASYQG